MHSPVLLFQLFVNFSTQSIEMKPYLGNIYSHSFWELRGQTYVVYFFVFFLFSLNFIMLSGRYVVANVDMKNVFHIGSKT